MLRKLALVAAIGGALALGGCGKSLSEIATAIVTGVKGTCGLITTAEDLVKALTGLDVSKIEVAAFVKSICDQFAVLEQNNAPAVEVPAQLRATLKASSVKCYKVIVNNNPVTVCRE